jgi:hypothetical protein|tara:strand:+ start:7258 stop:7767 length:510 start_codon:yes stop_codon:yes gene_type:complete
MQDTEVNMTKEKELEAKQLVPNKFWIVQNYGQKVGTLQKNKEGYILVTHKDKIHFENVEKVYDAFGKDFFEHTATKKIKNSKVMEVHGFPTSTQAWNPLLDVQNNLPLYSKSRKSKSLYCAGYYTIRFAKGWVKSFCPKLITLQRYDYKGPFTTELEMRQVLSNVSKSS